MTAPALDIEQLLTPAEVAAALKVNKDWLYDEVQAGRIKSVRLGRRSLRFRAADITEYIDSLVQGGQEI